jgi:hypothetical protein
LQVLGPFSKTIACAYCEAQIDLTSPQFAFYGGLKQPPITAPIKVGQTGAFRGKRFRVIGHLRLAEQDWWWDEYQLLADDGTTGWLQYDDGAFALYDGVRLQHPLDPMSIGSTFHLGKVMYRVLDRGRATISRIEGELTWKAKVGDPMAWIDAVTPDIVGDPARPKRLGVEWSVHELELFGKTSVTWREVAEAFGMTLAELGAGCYRFDDDDDEDDDDGEGIFSNKTMLIAAALLIFVVLLYAAAQFGGDGDDDYGQPGVAGAGGAGVYGGTRSRPRTSYRRGGYSRGSGFSFGK